MSPRLLVAYATRCGSSAEIAEAIGVALRKSGASVDVLPIKQVRGISDYQGAVIGSAVRMGRPLGEATRQLRRWRKELATIPTAYFTVSLTMQEDSAENRKTADAMLDGWREIKQPISTGLFGGVLAFDKLSAPLRYFMSRSDEMEEGDYRDWAAIDAWAKAVPAAFRAA